jgi:hypothetical protein
VSFAALLLAYSVYADDNRNEDNTHWLESRLKSVETELTDENRKGIASPAIDRTFLSHKSETELEMERQEIEEREKEKLEKERSRPHAR